MPRVDRSASRPLPAAPRRAARIPALGAWLADAAGLALAILWRGLQPQSWRRPVREEAFRFADIACLQALPGIAVAAILAGGAVLAQALYWFARTGAEDVIPEAIAVIVIREVAPLLVGLLLVGRGGLIMLGELGTLVDEGQVREMTLRGVDPLLFLVLPRTAALMFAMFVLTVLFIVVSLTTGYMVASALDLVATRPRAFLEDLFIALGSHGALVLPLKAAAIGLTVGVTCTLTAWRAAAPGGRGARRSAAGFIRATLTVLLANTLLSLMI
jgi:phospholipid/cholesterol/gamma-HCH transport system permease protein